MAISSIGSSALSALTVGNHSASRAEMAQKMLKGMDTDQSGTVSKDEFVAFGEKLKAQAPPTHRANAQTPSGTNAPTPPSSDELFASTDKNGDQSLSVDELSSMLAEGEARARAQGSTSGEKPIGLDSTGGPPAGGRPPGGGAPGMGAAGGSKSSVSSSESDSSTTSSSTDPADTNSDGVVSAAEKLIYDLTHPSSSSSTSTTTS